MKRRVSAGQVVGRRPESMRSAGGTPFFVGSSGLAGGGGRRWGACGRTHQLVAEGEGEAGEVAPVDLCVDVGGDGLACRGVGDVGEGGEALQECDEIVLDGLVGAEVVDGVGDDFPEAARLRNIAVLDAVFVQGCKLCCGRGGALASVLEQILDDGNGVLLRGALEALVAAELGSPRVCHGRCCEWRSK